tara:strand:- start:3998 stop:4687 length:690 start_codon:yes stop_codon:yes gene_type:complete
MSKFNPEEFKAPKMEPLSNVTIDGYDVEWDKTADGLIGVFKGVSVRMEGDRAFVRIGGDFTDAPIVETDLVMEDGDIKLGVAMAGMGKITDIDPEIFNKEMKGGFAEDKPLICTEQNPDVDPNKMNGSRMQMVGKISDPSGAKAECGSRIQMAGRQPVYCRESSCGSCGAPVSFYRVDTKTFEEAKYKGKAPRNFTDEELESIFGDFGEIDGVIYDDTRLCSQCRSYEC